MSLDLSLSLTMSQRKGSSAPVTYTAPFYSDFAGATGGIDGYAATNGLLFSAIIQPAAADTSPTKSGVRLSGDGKIIGQSGGANYVFQYAGRQNTAISGAQRRQTAWRIFNDLITRMHVGFSGTPAKNHVAVTVGANGALSAMSVRATVNGTQLANNAIAANTTRNVGDAAAFAEDFSGANRRVTLKLNGRALCAPFDMTAAGSMASLIFTEMHGFEASAQTSSSKTVDDMWIWDPDAEAFLEVNMPNHTVQRETNGDIVVNLRGTYGGASLAGIHATYQKEVAGVVSNITGYVDIPLTTFSAAAGSWSGTLRILSADVQAPGYLKLDRTDMTGGVACPAYTPRFWRAIVSLTSGQSLGENATIAGGTALVTQTALTTGAQEVHAGTEANYPSLLYNNRSNPPVANSANAVQQAAMLTMSGEVACATINGARGGSNTGERSTFGTNLDLSIRETITRAGGNFEYADDWSGPYDGSFTSAQFQANLTKQYFGVGGYSDMIGHSYKVVVNPTTADWADNNTGKVGGSDDHIELIRRAGGWELPLNDARFVPGIFMLDASHNNGAQEFHWNIDWSAEQRRRTAIHTPWALGLGSGRDLRGPSLAATGHIIVNDHTLRLFLNMNGFDGLAFTNTAEASAFHGGIQVDATSSAFGARIWPTSNVVNAIVAGVGSIDLVFAGTPFVGGTAWVRCMHGGNPLCPLQAPAALLAWRGGSNPSMFYGTKTGETQIIGPGIPLRPYWSDLGAGGTPQDFVVVT